MIVERSTIAKKKLNCRWASRCQFSEQLFRETGAGGRCLQCRGNRDGAKCEVGFPKPSLPHFPERFAWPVTIRDQEMGRPSLDRACFAIAIPREVSATSVMIRGFARASREWLGQGLQMHILLLDPRGALVAIMCHYRSACRQVCEIFILSIPEGNNYAPNHYNMINTTHAVSNASSSGARSVRQTTGDFLGKVRKLVTKGSADCDADSSWQARQGVVSLVAASKQAAWKTEPTATWQTAPACASKTWRGGTVTNAVRAISRFNNFFGYGFCNIVFLPGVKKQPMGLHPLLLLRSHGRVRVGTSDGWIQRHQ